MGANTGAPLARFVVTDGEAVPSACEGCGAVGTRAQVEFCEGGLCVDSLSSVCWPGERCVGVR